MAWDPLILGEIVFFYRFLSYCVETFSKVAYFYEHHLPQNKDIQSNKGEDGKKNVENDVEPENIDVDVPKRKTKVCHF